MRAPYSNCALVLQSGQLIIKMVGCAVVELKCESSEQTAFDQQLALANHKPQPACRELGQP